MLAWPPLVFRMQPTHPEHAAVIQQVLTIPQKRFDRAIVSFLSLAEFGRRHRRTGPKRTGKVGRDHALFSRRRSDRGCGSLN